MIKEIVYELDPNHIGIIIPCEIKNKIEKDSGNFFVEDKIQGVSVCFVWDESMNIFKEYITQEGRAKNYKLGYNHICFDIDTHHEMRKLHKKILKSRLGVRLTLPEPSPTKQCNIVTFYKILGLGIVEFNILD
ncbi:MAG: hypothetical protein CMD06_03800 [Flavobacteriales bacterium]|nr:hypothetical protein [Flavobacteriales bacterium]|tara:strand:+ start:421 stop:819 length:399 start_codon:yes stop_codon:yes gene_type:complete